MFASFNSKFIGCMQAAPKRSFGSKKSMLTDVFGTRDARKDSQSNLLSKKERNSLYKIQFHNVKPAAMLEYKALCSDYMTRVTETADLPVECVGSWSCWYGNQDTVVHLWRYQGGYKAIGEVNSKLSEYDWYRDMRSKRSLMLRERTNQLLMEFSFWGDVVPREGPNIYELRSYHLKPGTLIEWANNWAKGIQNRQANNEAVGGFFSEIGELNVVHHLWAYRDLEDRKETRGVAWSQPEWENVVYYTTPLIRRMSSSIMIPLPHSPLQ